MVDPSKQGKNWRNMKFQTITGRKNITGAGTRTGSLTKKKKKILKLFLGAAHVEWISANTPSDTL